MAVQLYPPNLGYVTICIYVLRPSYGNPDECPIESIGQSSEIVIVDDFTRSYTNCPRFKVRMAEDSQDRNKCFSSRVRLLDDRLFNHLFHRSSSDYPS